MLLRRTRETWFSRLPCCREFAFPEMRYMRTEAKRISVLMEAVTLSAGNAEDRVSGRFSVKELVKVSFEWTLTM